VNEIVHFVGVDLGGREIRRQHDRRAIEHLAVGDLEFSRERCAFAAQRNMREDQVGSRRSDIDADALEREHLEPFDVGDDFIFLDDEIVGMIMIINIVVHEDRKSTRLNSSHRL